MNTTGTITLRFTPPSQGSDWLLEALGDGGLLAFAPGPEFDDGNGGGSEEGEESPSAPERLPE